jgi:hypothetical protein
MDVWAGGRAKSEKVVFGASRRDAPLPKGQKAASQGALHSYSLDVVLIRYPFSHLLLATTGY